MVKLIRVVGSLNGVGWEVFIVGIIAVRLRVILGLLVIMWLRLRLVGRRVRLIVGLWWVLRVWVWWRSDWLRWRWMVIMPGMPISTSANEEDADR